MTSSIAVDVALHMVSMPIGIAAGVALYGAGALGNKIVENRTGFAAAPIVHAIIAASATDFILSPPFPLFRMAAVAVLTGLLAVKGSNDAKSEPLNDYQIIKSITSGSSVAVFMIAVGSEVKADDIRWVIFMAAAASAYLIAFQAIAYSGPKPVHI